MCYFLFVFSKICYHKTFAYYRCKRNYYLAKQKVCQDQNLKHSVWIEFAIISKKDARAISFFVSIEISFVMIDFVKFVSFKILETFIVKNNL